MLKTAKGEGLTQAGQTFSLNHISINSCEQKSRDEPMACL